MKIGRGTYGLFLISNNCYSILHSDERLRELKSKLGKIKYKNSWTFFGVHDTAILVRSDDHLDPAINAVGNWVAKFVEETTYLFSWEDIPRNDSDGLRRFLMYDRDIGWAEDAKIRKSNDGKTVHIRKGENSAEIMIDENEEKATLKSSDGRTYDLKVKREDGKRNIYKKSLIKNHISSRLESRLKDTYLKSSYLFSWEDIPGNDSDGLRRFLMYDRDIGWVEDAKIRKSNDGKTVHIRKGENSAEIMIDENEEKATLKISDGRTHDLKAKREGGKLNIYKFSIEEKCKSIAKLYKFKYNKYFRIFEYFVDPLIPIYVDDEKIESSDGVFLIMYIKFGLASVNRLLNNAESGNLQDLYKPFKTDDTAAIFHGFGLFDVVVIIKGDDYKDIRKTMIKIQEKCKPSISDTYSLISMPASSDSLGYSSLNCSMMVKIRQGAESPEIWNGIKELAQDIGLNGLCIRKVTDSELIKCHPYTSFRPGFFDVAIDLRFKNTADIHTFIDILEYMPFVEDTATVISYDTEPLGCDLHEHTAV